MAKTKGEKQPAKKIRDIAVNVERIESTVDDLPSIDEMMQGDGEVDESSDTVSLLDQSVEEVSINMPAHHHAVPEKRRGLFSRNGKTTEVMVKALVLNHTPRYVDCDAVLPLKKLQEAKIYPARFKNDWLYPVIIDQDGEYNNWPRQQNIALGSSSYILWLARNWPEHRVLNRIERHWWHKATSVGIIVVVILIILVIFLIMFFFISS